MKLVRVQLKDFRAFPGDFDLALPGGCNLLVHGENGSGKSSLAVALREFIALKTGRCRVLLNRTSTRFRTQRQALLASQR